MFFLLSWQKYLENFHLKVLDPFGKPLILIIYNLQKSNQRFEATYVVKIFLAEVG